ncbi:hypothetical protein M9H77_07615 [Catharanthus roseus]|uniref:Uncharacterized protein n=1 Tax=Catharanthus roseus TaxID=4058 RepID=A0ACC0BVM2_CATRO|nr:hypothetical protein M9H77_07615 [Catharanthus roseus]
MEESRYLFRIVKALEMVFSERRATIGFFAVGYTLAELFSIQMPSTNFRSFLINEHFGSTIPEIGNSNFSAQLLVYADCTTSPLAEASVAEGGGESGVRELLRRDNEGGERLVFREFKGRECKGLHRERLFDIAIPMAIPVTVVKEKNRTIIVLFEDTFFSQIFKAKRGLLFSRELWSRIVGSIEELCLGLWELVEVKMELRMCFPSLTEGLIQTRISERFLSLFGDDMVHGSKKKRAPRDVYWSGYDVYSSSIGFYSSGDICFSGYDIYTSNVGFYSFEYVYTSGDLNSISTVVVLESRPITIPSSSSIVGTSSRPALASSAHSQCNLCRMLLTLAFLSYRPLTDEILGANGKRKAASHRDWSSILTDKQLMFEAADGSNKGYVYDFSLQSIAITVERWGDSSSTSSVLSVFLQLPMMLASRGRKGCGVTCSRYRTSSPVS